jgi:anti-sigma regulatory factor (Ser/Thr protein kinase)
LELAALDTAAGSARAHVGAVLREWSLGDIAADACLVVSELVTNAVLSTRTAGLHDPVRIWALGDGGGGALLLVWDATMSGPVRRAVSPDAEHGRGLTIVDALSVCWGSYEAERQLGGKVVWALMASGRNVSEPLEGLGPARVQDADALAPPGWLAPALPVRRTPVLPLLNGMRALNRTPVAPHILVRVKAALERLDDHRGRADDAG